MSPSAAPTVRVNFMGPSLEAADLPLQQRTCLSWSGPRKCLRDRWIGSAWPLCGRMRRITVLHVADGIVIVRVRGFGT
jgi:hypothetical protein